MPENINKLAQKAPIGTTLSTPVGAKAVGGNPDQAKMVGTKVQRQANLESQVGKTLEQTERLDQSRQEATQEEQQTTARAAQLKEAGSLVPRVQQLMEGYYNQQQSVEDPAQRNQVMMDLLDQGKANLGQIMELSGDEQAFGDAQAELMTSVLGEDWAAKTPAELEAAIEAERAATFSEIDGIKAQLADPNTSPAERDALKSQLRDLGGVGVTGAEVTVEQAEQNLEAAEDDLGMAPETFAKFIGGEDQGIVDALTTIMESGDRETMDQVLSEQDEDAVRAGFNATARVEGATADILGLDPDDAYLSGEDLKGHSIEDVNRAADNVDLLGKEYGGQIAAVVSTKGEEVASTIQSAMLAEDFSPEDMKKVLDNPQILTEVQEIADQAKEVEDISTAVNANKMSGADGVNKLLDIVLGTAGSDFNTVNNDLQEVRARVKIGSKAERAEARALLAQYEDLVGDNGKFGPEDVQHLANSVKSGQTIPSWRDIVAGDLNKFKPTDSDSLVNAKNTGSDFTKTIIDVAEGGINDTEAMELLSKSADRPYSVSSAATDLEQGTITPEQYLEDLQKLNANLNAHGMEDIGIMALYDKAFYKAVDNVAKPTYDALLGSAGGGLGPTEFKAIKNGGKHNINKHHINGGTMQNMDAVMRNATTAVEAASTEIEKAAAQRNFEDVQETYDNFKEAWQAEVSVAERELRNVYKLRDSAAHEERWDKVHQRNAIIDHLKKNLKHLRGH